MPDYENDLAFKPAMTYTEARKHAKELSKKGNCIYYTYDNGFRCGSLFVSRSKYISFTAHDKGIKVKSFERVKNIIDNLYGED
jgi:hypothetical protein